MINSKLTNTKKVFKDFAKYSVKTNVTMKIIYTLAVLILAASVVLFVSNQILDGVIFAVLGVIFALCTPAMEWLNVTNNKSNVGSVDEFQFYEDRFVVTSYDKKGLEISDSTLIYNRLYKVKKYLNYGYIYVNKAVAYIVDKNEFENEEQFNFVLDRINQAIVNNKKTKGTTPIVFGSQNVTAPTEEPPQDLGEPVPPPPTEEDLAYEEEQKENQRITSFDGEQKIDYEGDVTIVALDEKEENEEDTSELVDENVETEDVEESSEVFTEDLSEDDSDDDDIPAEQTFDVENETAETQPTLVEEDALENEEVEVENEPMADEVLITEPVAEVQTEEVVSNEENLQQNDVDVNENDDDNLEVSADQENLVAPTEEIIENVEEAKELDENVEEPIVSEEPVVANEEAPAVVVAPVQEEEKPAEDKAEEVQPKKRRGRPAGSTKKPKEDDGEEKPKRKRGRPAGTTKKKPTEKKSTGKRGRPAKPKAEKEDKPKGKRGRPAKPKTAEENKPKGKRGRPAKKKVEEVEPQQTQDVAVAEEKQVQQTPVIVAQEVEKEQVNEIEKPVETTLVEQPVEETVVTVPPVVEETTTEETPQSVVEEAYQPTEEVSEEQNQVFEPVANNVEDDNNNDEGDEIPAEQQPVNFDMPNDLGEEETEEEAPQQVSQADLDEVAALQAEYNMTEEPATQVENQTEDNLLNEERPFVQPASQQPQSEEDFENIEGPADLGEPASTTYQPPIIEDTEKDTDAYDAENETFTVSTGDEGAVENQNAYINDVNENDDANNDDIGNIDVNIDDVTAVVDSMPEDVEGENSEEVNVDEFPTDIDNDTTKNN